MFGYPGYVMNGDGVGFGIVAPIHSQLVPIPSIFYISTLRLSPKFDIVEMNRGK